MKAKSFSGGYMFRGFEGHCKAKLDSLGLPSKIKISIPLSQGSGISLEPGVKVGDRVHAGQIIARNDKELCSPIHSSVNGVIVGIEKRNYFRKEVDMVIIEAEQNDDYHRIEGYSPQWEESSSEEIGKILFESGVASLDRDGIPTHARTAIIAPQEVEDLIINGVSAEVYNTSLDVLLEGKNLSNFVEGIKILKKVMPEARIHLALNDNQKLLAERIGAATVDIDKFMIHPVRPKYPQSYDEVLVPTLLGRKFPYGYSAANIGVVILMLQTVLHVYEAVVEGKPLMERIVALCGPSFKGNLHVKVKIGTPLEHILKNMLKGNPSRIILNSLLTGANLTDLSLPVDKTFFQIIAIPEEAERKLLAFLRPGIKIDSYSNTFLSSIIKRDILPTTNMKGEERPCIQCGYCMNVCPVGIIPALLDRYVKYEVNENLLDYRIFNCIDCNLCSYVCTSKIPLAKSIKEAKAKLIDMGFDHSLCVSPDCKLKGLDRDKNTKTVK